MIEGLHKLGVGPEHLDDEDERHQHECRHNQTKPDPAALQDTNDERPDKGCSGNGDDGRQKLVELIPQLSA